VPATAALSPARVALIRTQRAFGEAVRRERAESALRQTQRLEAIGKLTAAFAHDFNNLLMVVKARRAASLASGRLPTPAISA